MAAGTGRSQTRGTICLEIARHAGLGYSAPGVPTGHTGPRPPPPRPPNQPPPPGRAPPPPPPHPPPPQAKAPLPPSLPPTPPPPPPPSAGGGFFHFPPPGKTAGRREKDPPGPPPPPLPAHKSREGRAPRGGEPPEGKSHPIPGPLGGPGVAPGPGGGRGGGGGPPRTPPDPDHHLHPLLPGGPGGRFVCAGVNMGFPGGALLPFPWTGTHTP